MIAQAEISLTILSEGWSSFPPAQSANVRILPAIGYTRVFQYMEETEIVLNVMPWFKARSHERIFNFLEQI